MRLSVVILVSTAISGSFALQAKKEEKVVLTHKGDTGETILTFYSVHVPNWIIQKTSEGAKTVTDTAGSVFVRLAHDAKIPEPKGKIDPESDPDAYRVSFPKIFLNNARLRYVKPGASSGDETTTHLQIACMAQNGDTIVSYEVPQSTKPEEIFKRFQDKSATPTFRAEQPKKDQNAFEVDDNTGSLEGHAWLAMQDFCTVLIKQRQMFLNQLRNEMIEKFDPSKLPQITKEEEADIKDQVMVMSEGGSADSPSTTLRIFDVKNEATRTKLVPELQQVLKRGRCLGKRYEFDANLIQSETPVIGLIDTANSAYTKLRCFSFFEGRIVPVVEISEPRDSAICNQGTEQSGDDVQSFVGGIWNSIKRAFNEIAGGSSEESAPFRMLTGSVATGVVDAAATDAAAAPSSNINEEYVESLCKRLTQDYLLIVRDDDIGCDDCLMKYSRGIRFDGGVVSGPDGDAKPDPNALMDNRLRDDSE